MPSTSANQALINRLKLANLRVTQPRLAVFECLLKSKKPLTPKTLLERLRSNSKLRNVDPVSIYRILETFAKLGLVHQISQNGGFLACNHLACDHGLHVIAHCSSCGVALEGEVPESLAREIKKKISAQLGFEMDSHYFQTSGLCNKCK